MAEESKQGTDNNRNGRRVFGVVLRGEPQDFQHWLDAAKTYELYVIFSKSTRTGKLVITEESW